MILSAMFKALAGRRRWLKLKRKYNIDINGYYAVMMPDADQELNEYALTHIDNFLSFRKGNGIVILTTDAWVANNADRFSDCIIAVEQITIRDFVYYNSYYYYYNFSERFIMVSLRGNYGIRLSLAENVNGITKEDMTCLGLYIIRNWAETGAANG